MQCIAAAEDVRGVGPEMSGKRGAVVVLVTIRSDYERVLRSVQRDRDQAHRGEVYDRFPLLSAHPMSRTRIFLAVALALALGVSPLPAFHTRRAALDEPALVAAMNRERASYGLQPLHVNLALSL